jgi:hypothetical protein
VPLEGMRRSDADVVVKLLGSKIKYTQPVEDPWFFAHRPIQSLDITDGHNVTMFVPDTPLTGIGCVVQVCRTLSLTHGKVLMNHSINFASKLPSVSIAPNRMLCLSK